MVNKLLIWLFFEYLVQLFIIHFLYIYQLFKEILNFFLFGIKQFV